MAAKFILARIETSEDGHRYNTVGPKVKLLTLLEAKKVIIDYLKKEESALNDVLNARKKIIESYATLESRSSDDGISIDPESVSEETLRVYEEAFSSKYVATGGECITFTFRNLIPISIIWDRIEKVMYYLNRVRKDISNVNYSNAQAFQKVVSSLNTFNNIYIVEVEEDTVEEETIVE